MIKVRFRENPKKYADIMSMARRYCSCGHTINIPNKMDKIICSHCGNYVFKDKKTEFEYRLKEAKNNLSE